MKALLNKKVHTSTEAQLFNAADMNAVASIADQIIGSGKYQLSDNYFENFAPTTMPLVKKISGPVKRGGVSSDVRSRWFCTLHYKPKIHQDGTVSPLWRFLHVIRRWRYREKKFLPVWPMYLVSTQASCWTTVQWKGEALKDRKGNPLSFTKEVAIKESGDNLEVTGIRVIKYPIDYKSGDNVDNDYVYYRYSDVLLMKAEALLRQAMQQEHWIL